MEHIVEQEMCIVGGILKTGLMDESLTREHFTQDIPIFIWDYITRTFEENGAVDLMSVRHTCMQLGEKSWFNSLTTAVKTYEETQYPAIALKHVRYRHFVRVVRSSMNGYAHRLKNLENSLSEKQLMGWVTDFVDTLTEAAANVFDASSLMPEMPLGEHGQVSPEQVIDESLRRNQSKEAVEASYSGYPEVARRTEMGESVWTLAAPTGLGKTSYALYDAYHLAKNGYPVLYFSTEMSQEQVIKRLVGIDEPGVPMSDLFQRCLEDKFEGAAKMSVRRMKEYPFFFADGLASVHSLAAVSMRLNNFLRNGARSIMGNTILVNEARLHTIWIDYIQQTDLRYYSPHPPQALSDAMTDVRRLSNRTKSRVVVVSQMNRDVNNRQVKEPQLSDLKDSSALEQMSNVVAFLHREDYYMQPDTVDEYGQIVRGERPSDPNSYLIVRKNRNNEPFKVPLEFIKHRACYVPLKGTMDKYADAAMDDLITSDLDDFGI